MGAIPVCQSTYSQTTSYTGTGSINELNATNQGCLTTGENNSVWYIVNVTVAGSFTFSITPNTATDDYDFALWDITDLSCDAISNGQAPLRCNYASLANSSAGGLTGLSTTAAATSYGAAGPSFSSSINAQVGQTFVLCINNASASTSGYLLSFGGTSSVVDNIDPLIKADTIEASCSNPTFVKLLLTENIQCSSLAANGSDFTLAPSTASISSVNSVSCANGADFTNLITLNFSSALPPGTYTLSVGNGTDGNTLIDNCNNAMPVGSSITFTVQPPVQIGVNTQFGCSGLPSGSILASGTGGNGSYTYKLNNGPFTSNNNFTNLTAGSYTITIQDSLGCTSDTTVNLVSSPPIVINGVVVTNPLCFGVNDGEVSVSASGGNPPLTYAVGSSAYSASNIINNLSPGNHVIHVQDANGCIKDTVIFISAPGQLSFTNFGLTPSSCGQNNGSISSTAFGGTPPLTFSLNGANPQATGNYNGLAAGSYLLSVVDDNGCFIDTTIVVTQLTSVSINSITLTQPTCAGGNGVITINASGGQSPYDYSIDNGTTYSPSNTFNNLSSATYTVIVEDASGCTASSVVVLNSPGNLSYASATVVQPTCLVQGSITVQGNGGTTPYTYAIGVNPYSANNTFNNLTAGTYTIHLQDANGCIHDTIITLNLTQSPVFDSVTFTDPSCSFPQAGDIGVNVSGGTPNYTYSINGGPSTANSNFNNLGGGSYTIVVTDANGCTSSTMVNLVSTNNLSFTNFSFDDVGCLGAPLGSITSTIGNGNPAYSYSLNGGPAQNNGNFSGLSAGTYTVLATDASGCTISTVVNIQSSGTLQFNSIAVTNSTCFNPQTGSIVVNGTVSFPNITYALTPGGTNTTGVFNNLGAGTYTLAIFDGAGCFIDTQIVITSPPPMNFTNVVVVPPPCFGGIGSISLMGAGGAAPYQFSLNMGAFGSNSSWSNLPGGTYQIQLQDANGCLHDTTIFLEDPPQIDLSNQVISNADCNNNATGSITLTASGGAPPFQYSFNGGPYGANNTWTNLNAGSYTITVQDSDGCTESVTIQILANGNFEFGNIGRTKPSCNGDSDGSITVNVTGGTAPIQYAISNGPFGNTNVFTGLSAGSYYIEVQDNAGCSLDTNINVINPPLLKFTNVTTMNPLCAGDSNGSINVTWSGGSGPKTLAINGGAFSSTNSFTNLTAGTYTITVMDNKGCTEDSVVTIVDPAPIGFTNISIISPGCAGTGTISLNGQGGLAPYTYALNGGTFASINSFANLPVGPQTISVMDANGCTNDTTINLNANTVIGITSLTYSEYVCFNFNNGTINVVANSPSTPLSYDINGGPPQANGIFTNLPPNTYQIHIEDNANCFLDTTIVIQQAPIANFDSLNIVNASCFNTQDGSIAVYGSGGIGPLQYSLNNGPYQSSNIFPNLLGGSYTINILDSIGCGNDTTINLIAPPAIVVNSINITQPFCSNATDGVITVNVSGGSAPYLYAINTSLYTTTNTFNNLLQGTYIIYVQDANGCVLDTTVILNPGNYMQFTNVSVQDVTCKNGNDGSINLLGTGGTPPYNYSLNSIPNGTSGSFNNLGVGSYLIEITDSLGCIADTTLIISEPLNALSIDLLNVVPNKCKGDSAGSITIAGNGGVQPYAFSIDGVNYVSNTTFNNLGAGFYQVYIQDANMCIYDSLIEVEEPDTSVQMILLGITPQSCVGADDGTITVSAQYGSTPYQFFFDGVNVGLDTFYNGLAPGNYIVEVEDSIGCRSSGKYVVGVSNVKPLISIDSIEEIFCAGDLGYLQWSATNSYPPYLYSFDGGAFSGQTSANNLSSGTYVLEVEDDKGCKADTTIELLIGNDIDLELSVTDADCAGTGDDGSAIVKVIGGIPPYDFVWSSSPGQNNDSIYNIRFGEYWLSVIDSANCIDTANFSIAFDPCCKIELPNAFTPNGDGLNEVWRVLQYGYIELKLLRVYNRWGNLVFETTLKDDAWDGTYKGRLADVGTYYFYAYYRCNLSDGEWILKKGDVNLIR